jgi:hypothetical protein
MSDNRLVYDETENMLKVERNCINPDRSRKLNLHYQTNMVSDPCFLDVRTQQSVGPGKYQNSNHNHCDTLIPDVVRTATNLQGVVFKNGFEVGAGVVDESTKLRIGKTKKFPKCPDQLFARPFLTVPFMGRGTPNDYGVELNLLSGEDTYQRRPCNVLSGITISQQYTPLIPHLSENIQNPVHIIEEVADESWTRGGANTQILVRDADYAARCGHAYMNKVHAGEAWADTHLNL